MNAFRNLVSLRRKSIQKGKGDHTRQNRENDAPGFAIVQLTKDPLPSLPWRAMKEAVLGKRYRLSVVVAGDQRTRALNIRYRGKSYIPNVLSFSLTPTNGEIFLNLRQARREYRRWGKSYESFVALLVVHAMLHLKGEQHGGKMERKEAGLLRKFCVDTEKYNG